MECELIPFLTGESVFSISDYVPPSDNSLRQCLQCLNEVAGKERLSHVGRHILYHERGLEEVVGKGGKLVS
jgi:hypothetical protein